MHRHPHTVPLFVVYLFLCIGLLSALSFRLLTIVNAFYPQLMRPLWYVGVFGYILFFAYRYHISEKRRRVIRSHDLLEKIRSDQEIAREDRERIAFVLSSITRSKENINYLVIVVLSLLAVAMDLLLFLG